MTLSAQAQTSGTQLTCAPCAVDFGSVVVGGSATASVTLTNTSNSAIVLTSKTKNAAWFYSLNGIWFPFKLGAQQSVTFQVVFSPASGQASTGSFVFNSTASNPSLTLSVSGSGATSSALIANPRSLSFGRIAAGSSATQTLTVTNPSKSSVTLSQISSSGGAAGNTFTVSGVSTPTTLTPGQSLTFQATFAPLSSGSYLGSLAISSLTAGSISVAETGFGMPGGVLSVSPSVLNFGNVTVGASQSQTVNLVAANAGVTVSSDSLGSSEYSISGLALPATLSAGQTVPVTVTFTPQTAGSANTSLSFSTSASSTSGVVASLVGTGVAATQHSVALAWQPSTSQVTGYNVYRGSQSAGPFNRISSADANTSFADDSVQSGSTYYYQVTSVDSTGMESAPSATVAASVPTS